MVALYDQSAYLLASFSDEIYMHPHGAALLIRIWRLSKIIT